MQLSDFVIQYFPSALQQVQNLKIEDEVLNVYEIALIYHYTDSGYETVNETLIQNKGIITTDYERLLNAALKKLPSYQGVVFRGAVLSKKQKQRYTDALNTNSSVPEPFYLSTSKSELIANQFSQGNTLYMIFSKTGKSIEKFAKFGLLSGQNEKEVLFLPNTPFDVVDITYTDSKTLLILEEIL
ncbi:MAG: ADP-ribosyltransferase [Spirosomataceae bacterium]